MIISKQPNPNNDFIAHLVEIREDDSIYNEVVDFIINSAKTLKEDFETWERASVVAQNRFGMFANFIPSLDRFVVDANAIEIFQDGTSLASEISFLQFDNVAIPNILQPFYDEDDLDNPKLKKKIISLYKGRFLSQINKLAKKLLKNKELFAEITALENDEVPKQNNSGKLVTPSIFYTSKLVLDAVKAEWELGDFDSSYNLVRTLVQGQDLVFANTSFLFLKELNKIANSQGKHIEIDNRTWRIENMPWNIVFNYKKGKADPSKNLANMGRLAYSKLLIPSIVFENSNKILTEKYVGYSMDDQTWDLLKTALVK